MTDILPSRMNELLPLKGKLLLAEAYNQILLHPETHNQEVWHSDCGTSHCLYGWVEVLHSPTSSPQDNEHDDIEKRVCEMVGLEFGGSASNELSYGQATLDEQYQIISALIDDRMDIHGTTIEQHKATPFDLDKIT
jgi:hypothetical protein